MKTSASASANSFESTRRSSGGTRSLSNSGAFVLGKSPTETFPYFLGQLDEVAFYPRALSATRVAAHRNAGRGT